MITAVAFGKDGKRLLVATSSNALLVYEVASQQLVPMDASLKTVLSQKLQTMPGSVSYISSLPDSQVTHCLVINPAVSFLETCLQESSDVALDPTNTIKNLYKVA